MRRAFRLPFGRESIARELDDELAFHLETRIERLVATGMSPAAAREEALRQFGDIDAVRRDCLILDHDRERAMRRTNMLDELRQDLVYAFRVLRHNPAFTSTVILTLALGIGANTAIFTLVNAVLLRPLPVHAPHELIAIGDPRRVASMSQSPHPDADLISYPLYRELRDRNPFVSGLLASGRTGLLEARIEKGAADPNPPRGRFVSGNYFSVLGVPALRGRTLDATDDAAIGASPVVVISHGYWTTRFGADPSAIGRTFLLNGAQVTIVGVTPEWFTSEIVGQARDLWIPISMQPVLSPQEPILTDRTISWLLLLGRLSPGTSREQAVGGFTALIRQLIDDADPAAAAARAAGGPPLEIFVASGEKGFSRVRDTYRIPLLTLMAGAGLLLLIICANVANLLLARALARAREISVRLAIGAGRGRLIRQLLTESLLLALISAGAGLLIAWWGSRMLLAFAADGGAAIPLAARLDLPVLGFTLGLSVLAVILFGLVPAVRASRVDLATTMRANSLAVAGGAFGHRGQRAPLGRVFIAAQVALSLVLLVGAGLLTRSVSHLLSSDPGLDRDHLLIVDLDARASGHVGPRLRVLTQQLSERFARLPGVTAVAYSKNGIFSGAESILGVQVPGFTASTVHDTIAHADWAGPGYVHAIGARLLRGRELTESDATGPRVALINLTMERFYFGGASGIGKTFRLDDTTVVEIVGVIGDVTDQSLDAEPVRRFYLPYHSASEPASLVFELRSRGDPALLTADVHKAIRAVDANMRIYGIEPLTTLMRQSIRGERLLARLASGFSALALLLAAIGVYGVMTYAIARRTGEIGLRVALGAQPGAVVRMVLGDTLRLVLIGMVIGIPLALAATRVLKSQLHDVDTADPIVIAVSLAVLALSAILAALIPALRAARVSPIVALQQG